MVYFFIIWPERNEDWEMGVRHCLRTAVPNAPMDSHLYIIHLELGTLSAWEYYTVKDVPVFERINLEMESDLMRRVIRRGDFRGVTFKGVIHVIKFISSGMYPTYSWNYCRTVCFSRYRDSYRYLFNSKQSMALR